MSLSSGGGAREYAPGSEEWMRLEAAPILQADVFKEAERWRKPHQGTPWFVWPLLAASVLAISSAGPVFEQMMDVPAVTLASWRLQLTTVLLFFGAVWQWKYDLDREGRQRVIENWKLLTASGICLAMHFGFWVWSLAHTSLTHSLLLVCSVPVLIAGGMIVLRKPISRGEVLGTAVGFSGGLLLALGPHDPDSDHVGLAGDLAALMGAVVFIGYLAAGRTLRQWMPIMVYACPVTGVAALLLALTAMLLEGAKLFAGGRQGVAGWLVEGRYARWVVYLSFVPGIVGHTGFNGLLRYLTPLTVSLAFQLEPLFGSLLGYMVGVVDVVPGWSTWVGGVLVLGATCVVTVATARREARQEAKGQAVVELEQVFASEQQGLLSKDPMFTLEEDSDDELYNPHNHHNQPPAHTAHPSHPTTTATAHPGVHPQPGDPATSQGPQPAARHSREYAGSSHTQLPQEQLQLLAVEDVHAAGGHAGGSDGGLAGQSLGHGSSHGSPKGHYHGISGDNLKHVAHHNHVKPPDDLI